MNDAIPSSFDNIPVGELEYFEGVIRSKSEYLDVLEVLRSYKRFGLDPISSPIDPTVPNAIARSLERHQPLSVIRLGDGEANIATFREDLNTPVLDRVVFSKIVSMQENRFAVSEYWMSNLARQMRAALLSADIVGVIGLWRPPVERSVEDIARLFRRNPRSISGHWRGISRLLQYAQDGVLNNKIITSAHLYFSILEHLEIMVNAAEKTVLLCQPCGVIDGIRNKYPEHRIEHIPLCDPLEPKGTDGNLANWPHFLSDVNERLPDLMAGQLCLIASGPWAELYADWVKERGGVGVDIGSGLDLLAGNAIRPAQKALGLGKSRRFQI